MGTDSLIMQFNLFDIFTPQNIICPLVASSRDEAISQLVNALPEGVTDDPSGVIQALIEREAIRTCGLGSGIAIPHVHCSKVNRPAIIIGVADSIDWKSIDNKPVQVICLIVTPQNKHTLRLLVWAIKLLQDRKVFNKIIECGPPERVYDYIQSISSNVYC